MTAEAIALVILAVVLQDREQNSAFPYVHRYALFCSARSITFESPPYRPPNAQSLSSGGWLARLILFCR